MLKGLFERKGKCYSIEEDDNKTYGQLFYVVKVQHYINYLHQWVWNFVATFYTEMDAYNYINKV